MQDIKELIMRNLYLKVDFCNRFNKVKGQMELDTKFYLIGTVPVLIIFKNGEKQTSSFNSAITVERDPCLRTLHKVKAEKSRHLNYWEKIKEVADELEKGILKLIKKGKLKGKEIEKLLIVNINDPKYRNTTYKTVLKKCKKASDKANKADSGKH